MRVVNSPSSPSSSLSGCFADTERQCNAGPGIALGVRGLKRGVTPRPGVCAREGGLVPGVSEGNGGIDGLDDGAVDIDEVTGDHGLEEALELRDKLRCGVTGTSGACSGVMIDFAVGRFGVAGLIVAIPSSSTLVEGFHGCFAGLGFMVMLFNSGGRVDAGEDEGVKL